MAGQLGKRLPADLVACHNAGMNVSVAEIFVMLAVLGVICAALFGVVRAGVRSGVKDKN